MPAKNLGLHGNAPDCSPIALLIIDMLNDFEFPGAESMFGAALDAARAIADLKRRCEAVNAPTIYVNDNFGKWRSDFRCQTRHCLEEPVRGRDIALLLRPTDDDYFVLKPKNSAFYATPLDVLLAYLGVRGVIVTGVTADSCVFFSASDAYIRDLHLWVPSDCVASDTPEHNTEALALMRRTLEADVTPSTELDLERTIAQLRQR